MTDFYLASGEGGELSECPRACAVRGETSTSMGIALVVEIDPPLPSGSLGLNDGTNELLLVSWRKGTSILDRDTWPIPVRVLNSSDHSGLGLGAIYQTEENALTAIKSLSVSPAEISLRRTPSGYQARVGNGDWWPEASASKAELGDLLRSLGPTEDEVAALLRAADGS